MTSTTPHCFAIDDGEWPTWSSDIARLGEIFFHEAQLPGRFDAGHFSHTFQQLMRVGIGHCIIATQDDEVIGAIGGLLMDHPFTGERTLCEQWWFVHPDARRSGVGQSLLALFEQLARDRGCTHVTMVHLLPGHDNLRTRFEARGYRQLEATYVKEVD